MAVRLVLYSRAYCHLCHDMEAALEPLRREFGFEVEVRDVDADAALEERYGELVPVLEHSGVELARYRLEPAALRAYLSKSA
jgi:thioredoxin reductase (NADPH)